jgi:hypothetical protein
VKYLLHQQHGTDIFESGSIVVNKDYREVNLVIGNVERCYFVDVETGVQEDDLFDGF